MIKKIFNFFFKKKHTHIDSEEDEISISKAYINDIDYMNDDEKSTYIKNKCEQIIFAQKNVEEIRVEYAAVTDYLSDVQRIKMLPKEKRKDLKSKVTKVIQLSDEKEIIRKRKKNALSEEKYIQMQSGQDIIPKDIKKLEEYEERLVLIEDDMRKLEGERGSLKYEKKTAIENQEFLKFIATTTLMMVVIFVCFCLCINKLFEKDMMLPFMIIIFVAAVICVYVAVRSSINRRIVKAYSVKMNRLVELMNKTKIKYVNAKSLVDYMYDKYKIVNSMELKKCWGEYQKQCENEKSYVRNAKLYDSYSSLVIDDLEKCGVKDASVWINQLDAIMDNEKLEQIEEKLISRREKLLGTIEYNNNIKDEGVRALRNLISRSGDSKEEVITVLKQHGITI